MGVSLFQLAIILVVLALIAVPALRKAARRPGQGAGGGGAGGGALPEGAPRVLVAIVASLVLGLGWLFGELASYGSLPWDPWLWSDPYVVSNIKRITAFTLISTAVAAAIFRTMPAQTRWSSRGAWWFGRVAIAAVTGYVIGAAFVWIGGSMVGAIDAGYFGGPLDVAGAAAQDFFYYLPEALTTGYGFGGETVGMSVAANVVFLAIVFWPAAAPDGAAALSIFSERRDVVSFRSSSNEPKRLLLGLAACGRFPGAKALEQEAEHPCQARPFPLDVERGEVLELIQRRAGETLIYALVYSGIAMLGLVAAAVTESPAGFVLAGLGAAGVFVRRLWRDKFAIAPRYAPDAFDRAEGEGVRKDSQNLVVYAGYDPFAQFGITFGNWFLSVDAARPVKGEAGPSEAPEPAEIERRVTATLARTGLLAVAAVPIYFVQGANIPPTLKAPGARRPAESVRQEDDWDAGGAPDAAVRRYLWVRRRGWRGELSLSYFIRVTRTAEDVGIEIAGVYMPPIAAKHRWVDNVAPPSWRRGLGDILYGLLGGPVMMAWSPIHLFLRFSEVVGRQFSDPRRPIERAIEANPSHDFGVATNLRRRFADPSAASYFQNADRRAAETAFTGRILRAFIDYLDDCGIDTSELREQRAMMLNQGIIVQGGDLKAENVAAGAGAMIGAMSGRSAKRKEAA